MAMQIPKDTFLPYGRMKEINGNYDHCKTDDTERVKERQDARKAEKAKEAEKAEKAKEEEREKKIFEKWANPQDEYIPSEEVGKKPAGTCQEGQGKPAEKCITNTDKVDREIRKLKEKQKQLEQQIRSASVDEGPSGRNGEKKIRELERKLAQVENELSRKDNDTYRRQNASVSQVK